MWSQYVANAVMIFLTGVFILVLLIGAGIVNAEEPRYLYKTHPFNCFIARQAAKNQAIAICSGEGKSYVEGSYTDCGVTGWGDKIVGHYYNCVNAPPQGFSVTGTGEDCNLYQSVQKASVDGELQCGGNFSWTPANDLTIYTGVCTGSCSHESHDDGYCPGHLGRVDTAVIDGWCEL